MEYLTTSEAADYFGLENASSMNWLRRARSPVAGDGQMAVSPHELDLWVLSGLAATRHDGRGAAGDRGRQPGRSPEWSLRESGSGLASLTEGTLRGVDRLQRGECSPARSIPWRRRIRQSPGDANISALRALPGLHDAVLVGVVRREQGLLLAPATRGVCRACRTSCVGRNMAVRQPGAGAQLCSTRCSSVPASTRGLRRLEPPCLTGNDLAAAIRAGSADCGIAPDPRGIGRARFRPATLESFDLLMRQRSYFRPAIQSLVGFLRDKRLKQRATELTGYDTAPAGQIRFAA